MPVHSRKPATKSDDSVQRPELGAIERTSLNDHAYGEFKRALVAGRIEPGMTLTFRQLAKDLGTSMMPVREAVARLVAERALEVLPRGIRVPALTREELYDVWELRVQLEGEAAARAAERATESELNRIELLCGQARASAETGSVHDFLEVNNDFHLAIYEATHTRVFLTLIEILRVQASPHRTEAVRLMLKERSPFFHRTLENNDELAEAIAKRDAARARSIKQSDIKETRAFVEKEGR